MKNKPVNSNSDNNPEADGSAQGVGLLVKAFQILDLFTDARPSWTQAELVRETSLPRSTLGRLVRFLAARGYLFDEHGRYRLGFAAVDLGRRAQVQFNLVDLLDDLLEYLAQTTGETVMLTAYDEAQSRVVCLAQIPSRQGGLRVFENVGAAFPLHCGASSKAVLAFLPQKQIDTVLMGDLRPFNQQAKARSVEELRTEIHAIQTCGYTISHEETYPGVAGFGVPILTPGGRPLGSFAVAAPLQRTDDANVEHYLEQLRHVASQSSLRLSGRGAPLNGE
ncbi:IclR family transcriptional regulator [Ensifer sp. MPMI2T]|nr:IclR family transcriptional regulator [Ensifer sp. MPMI2T]